MTEHEIESLQWDSITESLNNDGYAVVPKVLTAAQCAELSNGFDDPAL